MRNAPKVSQDHCRRKRTAQVDNASALQNSLVETELISD